MNIAAFMDSLRVMGVGMAGIFIITAVLIAVMALLLALFPADKKSSKS